MTSHERPSLPAHVRRYFSFLEGLGFQVVEETETAVRYESQHVYARITVDPRFGDALGGIALSLNLLDMDPKRREGYSIQSMLKALGVPRWGKYPGLIASRPESIDPALERLAEWARSYATPALQGDRAVFLRVAEYSTMAMKKYSDPDDYDSYHREPIRKAWDAGNCKEVALLYAGLDPGQLTEQEQRQREYARSVFLGVDNGDTGEG